MKAAFEVKSTRLEMLSLRLHTADLAQLSQFLRKKKDKYQVLGALPFVLDLDDLTDADADLSAIVSLLARQGIAVIAARGAEQRWADKVHAAGLFYLSHEHKKAVETEIDEHEKAACTEPPAEPTEDSVTGAADTATDSVAETKAESAAENNGQAAEEEKQPAPAEDDHAPRPTLVINSPVRTGQQVYAKNADLIVMGMVSEGAEVIADGNIHVYAPLRGRALAGESGDKTARIFVQSMQAELVSVAGIYRVFEQNLPPHLHKHAVKIELQEDERLAISAINAQ
ncbi:septum site-determining protein MinC [Kingella denitrificans]|uniref:septum site-determining protein MinC n=1 Tax=Kingella denitrificans TaxID=502 RepID=UPI0028D3A4A7|nr:septum site-determining protein MinC [Kingella denitrificans]